MSFPDLTSEQSRAVDVAVDPQNVQSPTAIAGPAGSGKTLVAAAIAERLASQSALDLFGDGSDSAVYFVTYTNQLTDYVAGQLADGADSELAPGPDHEAATTQAAESAPGSITVMTVHRYLQTFLETRGYEDFCFNQTPPALAKGAMKRRNFLKQYIEDNKANPAIKGCLADASFLDEEIGWMLGRGIRNCGKYLDAQRTGRRTRLTRDQREVVFAAYRAYMEHLATAGRQWKKILDFDDIGNQVLNFCAGHTCAPIASHLVIDEVQDLPITWIEALRKTVSGKVVYAGDTSQSIYGRGFTWRGLTGERIRPIRLTEDFRNTRQIYLAARSLMDFDTSPEKEIGRDGQKRRDGAKPRLVFCNGKQSQVDRIRRIVDGLRADDEGCTIAIGLPRRDEYLSELAEGIPGVIVTTMHSLKGLEADHVILANLDESEFNFSNEYTQEDTKRHLLYVGMTRAKKSLTMISATDKPSRVLYELSADFVELEESENPDAHQALIEMRAAQAKKARRNFEDLAKEKVESEEAVEQAAQDLREADAGVPPESGKDALIAELEQKLREAEERAAKADEKLKRQEDELRVYRAREVSDRAARDESGTRRAERRLFRDDAKILILGGSSGIKTKQLSGIFKDVGLPRDAFKQIDYDDVSSGRFDASRLLGTTEYSDIFVSTTPHKAKGIGDASSVVKYLKDNQCDLPKLTVFENTDGTLKAMSKTDLKEALIKSALYAAVHQIDAE